MRIVLLTCLLALCHFTACDSPQGDVYQRISNPYEVAAINDQHINVVIEIPAGSNHKIEYDAEAGFVNDKNDDGSTRIIRFLPYPGNYGFIPGTYMDTARGGDGDALDVLVISESAPTGSLIPVIPIGALLLRDRGEIDTKLIAIPADESQQILPATDFLDFAINYDAARQIIENWFLNYKGRDMVEIIRWEDEHYAWEEVRKWKVEE
ncbi:inorganic pyrophosphatase [Lewinellaceae bacterium SD302]|nr:inorganic pyrophosphatase [Lewinellaceae bacterium SD302]